MIYDLTFEQGTIGSSGDYDSTSKVRTQYYEFSGDKTSVKITASDGLMVDILGYRSLSDISPVFDLYWYSTPHEFDLSQYDFSWFRVVLKRSNDGSLSPSDVSDCTVDTDYTWFSDGYPYNTKHPEIPEGAIEKPYPRAMWQIDENINNGLPFVELFPGLSAVVSGAFMNAVNLRSVYIPESVKKIGSLSFRNTALKRVKIAADCEFSDTSFPDGCEVERYDDGSRGQLFDRDGMAVLDRYGARIYVKNEE